MICKKHCNDFTERLKWFLQKIEMIFKNDFLKCW